MVGFVVDDESVERRSGRLTPADCCVFYYFFISPPCCSTDDLPLPRDAGYADPWLM